MVVQTERDAAKVRFDEHGLVPCVMQDARSGEVLTVAYMNEESLLLTLETREIHLYSRSRREIWHKGATSGNTQAVKALRFDCDSDAVLALVEPAGPACHTGERTCFFSGDMDDFYLNLGVYRFEEFAKAAKNPASDATFTYGRPTKGHAWHAFPWAELVRQMNAHVNRNGRQ